MNLDLVDAFEGVEVVQALTVLCSLVLAVGSSAVVVGLLVVGGDLGDGAAALAIWGWGKMVSIWSHAK